MTYSTNFNAFFPLTKNFTLEMTNPEHYCTIYFYSQPLIERYSISKYIFNLNQQTAIPSLTASLVTKGFFFGRLIPRTCNINEIKEGKTIMDFFEKPFPYAFYLKIGKEKQYTNIFFKMSDYKYTQQSSNDNFIVKAYQVERETIDQYIKQVTIKRDKGLIFSKYHQRDYIQLDFVKDMNTVVPKDEFCSITLKISNRIDLYLLRYRKL